MLYLYRYNFYRLENNFQKCLDNLVKFITLSENINLQTITLSALKNANQLILEVGTEELIIGCTTKLYNYCLFTKYLSFYLFPLHSTRTFTTLAVFAAINQDLFYEFLKSLV